MSISAIAVLIFSATALHMAATFGALMNYTQGETWILYKAVDQKPGCRDSS